MDNAVLDMLLLDELAMLIDNCDCDVLSSTQQPDSLPFWPSTPSSLHWRDKVQLWSNGVGGGGGENTDKSERSTEEPQNFQAAIAGERTLGSETKNRQKPAQRMSRSQREKARLALLRLKASQLQLTLDSLRETISGKKRSTAPRSSLAAASIWGSLTKSQQKERARAETENAELKKMVAAQVRFTKALERRIHQHDDELLHSSDTRVSIFDQVFAAHNLNSAVSSNKRLSEAQRMHFNFVESSVVPFDFVATADATWKHMATREARLTQHTQVIEQTEDMLATVRIMVLKKTSCETCCTTVYSVYKRAIQHDHVRLVWECYAESKEDPQSDVVLLQWIHTDWTKVSRSNADDGLTAALIQSFARINPPLVSATFTSHRVEKQSQRQRQDPSAFADALIASYQENVHAACQRIENELIDSCRKPSMSSNVV